MIGLAVYLTKLYGVFSTTFAALASVFILTLFWYSTLTKTLLVIFLREYRDGFYFASFLDSF